MAKSLQIDGAEVCPHCGSAETTGGLVRDELIRWNLVAADSPSIDMIIPAFAPVTTKVVQLLPEAPLMQTVIRVCASCFTVYCALVHLDMVRNPNQQSVAHRPGGNGSTGLN